MTSSLYHPHSVRPHLHKHLRKHPVTNELAEVIRTRTISSDDKKDIIGIDITFVDGHVQRIPRTNTMRSKQAYTESSRDERALTKQSNKSSNKKTEKDN